ncbi:hypothetical protein FRC02_002649 [Tulasnella sp. 418]|nr:hypothetical protein FRC02_002649 [Tulasnella sp. 418]
MVSKVTDYVLHCVGFWSAYEATQIKNVIISESLRVYVSDIKNMQMKHREAVVQSLFQAFQQLKELVDQNRGEGTDGTQSESLFSTLVYFLAHFQFNFRPDGVDKYCSSSIESIAFD